MLIQAVVESLLLLSCPLCKAKTTTVTTASATTRSTKTVDHVYMCSDDRCDERVMTVLLSSCFDIHCVGSGDIKSVEIREMSRSPAAVEAVGDRRLRVDKVKRTSNKRVRVDETPHHGINDDNNTTAPTFASPSPSQAHINTPAKRLKTHTPFPTAPCPTQSAYTTNTIHSHSSHWSCPCCTLHNIMQHLSCQACGSIRPPPPPPPAFPTATPATASTIQSTISGTTMSVPPLPYPTPSSSGSEIQHPHQHTMIDLIATDDSADDDDDGTHEGEGDIHIHMETIISEEHTPTVTPTITTTSTTTPYKGHDLIDLFDNDDDTDDNKCIVTDRIPYIHHLPHPLLLNTIGHNSDPSYTTYGERDMYDDDYILLGLLPYEDYSGKISKPLKRYDESTLCYIRTINTLLPSRTSNTHSKTPTTAVSNMSVVLTHISDSNNTNTDTYNNNNIQHSSSPLVFEPVTAEIYGRRYNSHNTNSNSNSNSTKGSTKGSNKSTGKSKFWGKHICIHINVFMPCILHTLVYYALTYIYIFFFYILTIYIHLYMYLHRCR